MGEDHVLEFLDPDQLRQMGTRLPDALAGAGAAEFIRAMDEAKAKAETSFRKRETSENWSGYWAEDVEHLIDRFAEFGTDCPWRPVACDYVWEMASAYLRSAAGYCRPDRFEAMATLVIDAYSEKVYERKLKRYEEMVWVTYEKSRSEFQEYARQRLDPLVRAEALTRWERRSVSVSRGPEDVQNRVATAGADGDAPNGSPDAARSSDGTREAAPKRTEAAQSKPGDERHPPAPGQSDPTDGSGFTIPDWLKESGGSVPARDYEKGSLDFAAQTDPIWRIAVKQEGPIQIIRLNGNIDQIDTSASAGPEAPVLRPELELRISEVTLNGRSQLRIEIESAFAGQTWPPMSAIVAPARSYAVKIFDINAEAYYRTPSAHSDTHQALRAMARNLLVDMFGKEWEFSPGEQVVRIAWEHDKDGWTGKEIRVRAGNDADPNCLYHEVVGDAVTYRYRFHAPHPPPMPGEPPGINVTNLEWWEYIGLKERHNVAMAVKPYLEDRVEHWKFICSAAPPTVETARTSVVPEPGNLAKSPAELAAQRRAVVMPILTKKRWSRGKWATEAGVGKNSIYGYLDGTRNLRSETGVPMAQVLGLRPEDLPE